MSGAETGLSSPLASEVLIYFRPYSVLLPNVFGTCRILTETSELHYHGIKVTKLY